MTIQPQDSKTALYQWHVDHAGRMVDFAGWQMPIQYASIIEEHHATRQSATLFDVSHMGRFFFSGGQVEEFLDRMMTRKITGMPQGGIRYSLVCREDGGILDDVLVYRLGTVEGNDQFSMVVNASNREKLWTWFHSQVAGLDVAITDQTEGTAMIAVQGPRALEIVNGPLGFDLSSMKYFSGRHARFHDIPLTVSRTGYTGEDGCELVVTNEFAARVWEELLLNEAVSAAGLGARDTLRLESGMPLYGHELTEEINPWQTSMRFAMSLKDRDFVGKEAVLTAMSDESLPVRVGLVLEGRRAARQDAEVFLGEKLVGCVTSGTFSPTLQQPIAMAYLPREIVAGNNELVVDIRGKKIPAKLVDLPFYKRK